MEAPYVGCERDERHNNACLFDVQVLMDQLHTRGLSDDEVWRWWDEQAPPLHLCHLKAAMRQLVTWCSTLEIPPGRLTEWVIEYQVNLAEIEAGT